MMKINRSLRAQMAKSLRCPRLRTARLGSEFLNIEFLREFSCALPVEIWRAISATLTGTWSKRVFLFSMFISPVATTVAGVKSYGENL
jgi:hypothetical protein